MTDAELADHAWWGSFWTAVEHAAFVTLIVALAIEFAALKLGEPHKKAVEDAKDLEIAELNNETARLRAKGDLTADAVLATAQATKANALAAQLLLALTRQLPGIQMVGFLSAEQSERIISKVKPFSGKQFDMDVDITKTDLERVSLLASIGAAVETAGWIKVASQRSSVAPVLGVIIEVDSNKDSELLDAAEALASALNAEGVAAKVNPKTETDATNAIHILVGPRP